LYLLTYFIIRPGPPSLPKINRWGVPVQDLFVGHQFCGHGLWSTHHKANSSSGQLDIWLTHHKVNSSSGQLDIWLTHHSAHVLQVKPSQ